MEPLKRVSKCHEKVLNNRTKTYVFYTLINRWKNIQHRWNLENVSRNVTKRCSIIGLKLMFSRLWSIVTKISNIDGALKRVSEYREKQLNNTSGTQVFQAEINDWKNDEHRSSIENVSRNVTKRCSIMGLKLMFSRLWSIVRKISNTDGALKTCLGM